MNRPAFCGVVVVLGCAAITPAAAQRVNVPARTPGTISGVVVDTTGRILDLADVTLSNPRRRVTAGADGRFRFDSLKPGKYTVTARRLGYYPFGIQVTLEDSGVSLALGMVPLSRTLPPVVTSAARGGISGVVARSGAGADTNNVLAGAKIQIVGGARRAVADSSGQFFIAAPPGKHMVSIKHDGYGSKLVSVNVPADSGRRILVWMSPGGSEAKEASVMEDLRQRIMRRNVVWSNLITREEILKLNIPEAHNVAENGAGHMMTDTCSAVIDGGPLVLPLWTIKSADIEFMEVYITKGGRQTFTSARNLSPTPMKQVRKDCETVYIWLRK